MRAGIVLLAASLAAGAVGPTLLSAAGEAKDKAKADEPARPPMQAPDPEWLGAVERLRLLPRPGEIKAGGVSAGLSALCGLPAEGAARCEAILKEYHAALLKLAAGWEQEAKAVRTEHEARLLQLLPDARRDAAQKALELSHSRWVTPHDREAAFRKEYAAKATAVRDSKLRVTTEEFEAARAKLQEWVHETRGKLIQQDLELLKQVRDLLSPEDAARLDQLSKHRGKPAEQKPEEGQQ